MLHGRAVAQRFLYLFGGCTELWSNMSAEAEIFAVHMTYGAKAATEIGAHDNGVVRDVTEVVGADSSPDRAPVALHPLAGEAAGRLAASTRQPASPRPASQRGRPRSARPSVQAAALAMA